MRKFLVACFSLLILGSLTVNCQENFNETRGIGINTGLFYWRVNKDFLIEPGFHYKSSKNIYLISNKFLLYEGQIMESAFVLAYRRYPFGNYEKSKLFLGGESQYYYKEGYYSRTVNVSGFFFLIDFGYHYRLVDNLYLGFDFGFGPGYVSNSIRYENNTLIFKSEFAFSISYTFNL
jgi:hypothetical protein